MKDEILRLRALGFSYNQIVDELGCSKSTVSFHCGEDQKSKSNIRQKARRAADSLIKKTDNFKNAAKGLNNKFTHFKMRGSGIYDFTYQDVKELIGDNPVCYLTGRPIDLSDPAGYHFDHIIPVSKGGDNSILNLGIACKAANKAKDDLTIEEFVKLCYDVVKHFEKDPF